MSVSLDALLDDDSAPSKYELRGKMFTQVLHELKQSGDFKMIYKHQIDAVLATRTAVTKEEFQSQRGESPDPLLIVAPTGSGKSGMIVMLPYVLRSSKVLILTPSIVISEQLARAFGIYAAESSFFEVANLCKTARQVENLIEHGKIIKHWSDVVERLPNLVIVNAQKFGGRSRTTLNLQYRNEEVVKNVADFFSQFDTLIVDEAHHFPAKTWELICNEFQRPEVGMQKKIIFLTATPYRNGGNNKLVPILEQQRIVFKMTSREVEGDNNIYK